MLKLFFAFAFALCAFANTTCVKAQNYPAPKEGDWVARDFRFHTGEVLPEHGSCFNKCTIMARRVGLCPCEVSSFFKAREKTLFA